jgi:hypothetical protein
VRLQLLAIFFKRRREKHCESYKKNQTHTYPTMSLLAPASASGETSSSSEVLQRVLFF